MARRRRVLVVEDDEILRETIAELVSDEGHDVRVAEDGVEALVETEHWKPDLVILDVMLPRMDAFEYRERQIATAEGGGPMVLLVSAATDLLNAATKLNADAWLAKPFTVDALMSTLKALLDKGGSSSSGGQLTNEAIDPSPC
jgi:DNA-binding response OmpR family regulator